MDQFAFALATTFGVPAAIIAMIVLAYRVTPKKIWYSRPVQALSVLAFLSSIGLPILIINIDSQGHYFDDETALVSEAFALPAGVTVDHQGDGSLRLGDCWRNAVNWRSEVTFPNAAAFDQWQAGQGIRQGIVRQVSGYFGQPSERISIAPDALDPLPRDPKHVLLAGKEARRRNTRIRAFDQPFVCTAIDRAADGTISLRRCDPIVADGDSGNAGQVIVNPDPKTRMVEGRIYYAQGPSTCTNPLRRAVNGMLGLPHPEGGPPNTDMGRNRLPIL